MKTYGKAVAVFLAFVLLTIFPATAKIAVPQPTDRFFVNDYADVLDTTAEQKIYTAGVQLFEKTKAQAVVVTVDTLDGAAVEDYALALARDWGIGNADDDNGILLLLAVEDREVRIEVGYGLEGAINDAKAGRLLDTYAIDSFAQNDFQSGLIQTYNAITNEVYLEYGMEADPNYTPVDDISETEESPLGMIAWVILMIVILTVFSRRGVTFLPFFFGHHHGGGGFHGGSFGGGGGFSGGGGSFGGGGASRKF